MSHLRDSIPRSLMAANNLLFSGLVFVKSRNETHVFNPRWPAHARFHNGQSLSFGAMASLTATWLLHRRTPTADAAQDSLLLAAIVGSMTAASGITAVFYPGSWWAEPEWDNGKMMGPQGWVFVGQLVLNWALFALEKLRLQAEAEKAEKAKKN